ncbi:NAD(P)/FAD-dependent oxidoreductase [Amycolatopsis saalfeldensis]|uniref:NADH dehydrogenase n=1 Tax=Amycolatopsis saalfeldensis TaxID=394193 RepID=A0A1H8YFL2_9PSEU|nr:NAD(P)/FAD-dependent oxidoreductase [Amycolatopsis saalfeldensis]SEP50862.1 NADH dehydrogenase [Amycolatopsis saalfeldensis]
MRVVIVGGGFAGYHAAKTLLKTAGGTGVEVVVVNPTDYFLYLPLLPEVAAGTLDPRAITVSIPDTLPGVRLALGTATAVDLDGHTVTYTDPEDHEQALSYDRLILAAGSVNKLLPIPGVAEYAHGFRGVPEALYLRDHVTRQIELAAAAEDQVERDARCTFVVVGAGYTGTEVAAQGPDFTAALTARHAGLEGQRVRWLLLDIADKVLPELNPKLGRTADEVLRARGVEVLMGTSVDHAGPDGVKLTNGDTVATRTLVWCVGVRPDPFVSELGLATAKGRIVVTAQLNVPGREDVFACGDAAAVPDLTQPGTYTAMTAQHAERQGRLAARNVAASLGHGRARTYRHHDLGFVVDLGAGRAAANPLHVPLSGWPAKIVTRAYHLFAMPGNRLRTATGWALATVSKRPTVQLGLVRGAAVPLDTDSPELPTLGH